MYKWRGICRFIARYRRDKEWDMQRYGQFSDPISA